MKLSKLFDFGGPGKRSFLPEKENGTPRVFEGWNDVEGDEERSSLIPGDVSEVNALLEARFGTDINRDVILRSFLIGGRKKALLLLVNGMADDTKINEFLLKPLMTYRGEELSPEALLSTAVRIAEVRLTEDLDEAVGCAVDGMTVLFIDGENRAVIAETRGFEKRSITPPENEKVVTGPKEGFTESLRTNITLIRRNVRLEGLVAEPRKLRDGGRVSAALVYIEGLTAPELIGEVKRRLARISTGGPVSSGIAAQLIEDDPDSPLPQILMTERPDRASSHLLQGRALLLIEGSPFALVMPVTFFSLMNSPEDVYLRKPLGTLLRLVRYLGAGVSVLLPGYFLALALYHQGILSTEVLSTVIASRRMVFEPIGVEMLLLLLIFQMIREAGQRVPGNIGQAIGIIGGLIMGQAAVAAHLASSVVLIIIAASGLGNFCIPDYSTQLAASYFRAALVLAAWIGGLLGITAAVLLAACHTAGLTSFGVPFLAPFSPRTASKRPTVLRGSIGMHRRGDDYANTDADSRVVEKKA